jgi:heme-degrading monooxygenase HmoA
MLPYIAMNQFQVDAAQATQFEERWRRRRSLLQDVPGFKTFQLLRGDETDGLVKYVSHSTWASKDAFIDWTHSDSFVQAHRGEPLPPGMVQGPPQLACFEVVDLAE